jgi:hypothetical protein
MSSLGKFIMVVFWVFGIVLAKGFWSTTIAIIIPLWGWYLVAETILIHHIM